MHLRGCDGRSAQHGRDLAVARAVGDRWRRHGPRMQAVRRLASLGNSNGALPLEHRQRSALEELSSDGNSWHRLDEPLLWVVRTCIGAPPISS